MSLVESTKWDAAQYGKFSALIKDYLTKNPAVKEFYSLFPSEENLLEQAKIKLNSFLNREVLQASLTRQLTELTLSEKQKENLEKLKLSNTLTITTGHQLNLFTGPLYFFYKILETIKTCDRLNETHKEFNFVPIFWMATEDHDFEEINHFYFRNQRFTWKKDAKGPVGRLNLEGLNDTWEQFFASLPDSTNAKKLKELIQTTYGNAQTLTEATRKLVQEIFSQWGLLMLDGDDVELKKTMIPLFEKELTEFPSIQQVEKTIEKFHKNHYHVQVNPREINLFYIGNGKLRERIVVENGRYSVLNTEISFTREEILQELHAHPERFSPNVILRPVYQESILPNVAYIGGSGEIAYWLELKSLFDHFNLPFPILKVRNSLLLLTEKQQRKLEKLNLSYADLFQPLYQIVHKNLEENTEVEIDFKAYQKQLETLFEEIESKAAQTDVSFSKMVQAQRKKQLSGLEKMHKRFIKAEKIKHTDRVERIEILYSELFPNGNLQERVANFSEFWLDYSSNFLSEIYSEIDPFAFRFTIKIVP